MDLSKLYEFSKSFGPPKNDLRFACICDDWGDETNAKMPINHKLPDDVTLEELLYYPQGWSFMDIDSVLFYAYAVFKFHDQGDEYWAAGVDGYFYHLDHKIENIVHIKSINILFDAIKTMWHEEPHFFDLVQCPDLQKALGIYVDWEDYFQHIEKKYPSQ